MTLFEEQLKRRIRNDELSETENIRALARAAEGKPGASYAEMTSAEETIRQTVGICRSLGIAVPEKIRKSGSLSEQIDIILQPSGAAKRKVELSDRWWKYTDGPMLARFREDGKAIALFPGRFRGYCYFDPSDGKKIRITERNKDLFEREAYCFYRPLPQTPLSGGDFIRFLLTGLKRSDVLTILLAALFSALLGLLIPFGTKYAFSYAIPSGKMMLLISLGVLLFSAALSTWLISAARTSVSSRIQNRLDVLCENAVYSRVIHLPASFFGGKSAGGLASKVMALNAVPAILTELLFGTFLTVLVSVVYIFQILTIAKPLAGPVLVIYLAEILLFALTVMQERKVMQERFSAEEENSGLVFALLSGIQKIKASGSEQRAFARWMRTYAKRTRPAYRILFPATLRTPLMTAVHMLGMLWIFAIAYKSGIDISRFAAFSSAFGLVMGGISALSAAGTSFSTVRPVLDLGETVLKAVPEETQGKKEVQKLSGAIRLENVTFRYSEDAPPILDNVSLQIDPGEYVAVVGRSGCGKSTMLKLLLGFEEPQQGVIYYDGHDLGSLDKNSLRRNIGTVLQDGKLFAGDIYSNITITAPWMSMDDAWNAAEKAGMAGDIREMPMGMHTLITEGSGGISGGQKQRLLIARAICPKPGILMLDEATSALDNITQKIVTDSMDEMACTRIVIAHRLSTIRRCDRILVLDGGRIAEDGTYEELLAANGIFAELVRRQMVEEA